MNISRINIGNGIYLNKVITDKFKSNFISINLIRPLDRSEVTKNSLLSYVLGRGTSSLPSKAVLERKLEELYGAHLSVNINKRGERQILRVSMEWADSRFTKDDTYEKSVLEVFRDIMFYPDLKDGLFSESIVEGEKKNLINRIEAKVNDKRTLALNRCIEEMCKGETFSIYQLGYVEDVKSITNTSLTDHYRGILQNSHMEIVYVGVENPSICEDLIPQEYLNRKDVLIVPREIIPKDNFTKNHIVEREDITQGKLVVGSRSNIPYEDGLYSALLLANEILGGGPNSKLFKDVREKNSLAYYVGTNLIKHKSIILLDAGIDINNYQKTMGLINEQFEDMKNGNFSDDDIEIAKKAIKTSSQSIIDSPHLMGEFTLGKVISKDNRSLEEMIEDIEKVSKEDIIKAMDTVTLDTIYFMTAKEVEQGETN